MNLLNDLFWTYVCVRALFWISSKPN